jgi:hypothetical protein
MRAVVPFFFEELLHSDAMMSLFLANTTRYLFNVKGDNRFLHGMQAKESFCQCFKISENDAPLKALTLSAYQILSFCGTNSYLPHSKLSKHWNWFKMRVHVVFFLRIQGLE